MRVFYLSGKSWYFVGNNTNKKGCPMTVSSHKYKQLSIAERAKIELLLEQALSLSAIAGTIKRSKSTISEEIIRGTHKGRYRAHIAQNRALKAKLNNHKLKKVYDVPLMTFIEQCLKRKWSPEIIVHKWTGSNITHTTIYNMIHTIRPEWKKHLIYQKKYKYRKGKAGKALIPDRVDISVRPAVINNRARIGDWEADTVISGREGKGCLGVFADRRTRLYKVMKMANKTAVEMLYATKRALLDMPVLSITYDNGKENARHEETKGFFESESYFCRPYRSGDKGTVEHKNKELRWYLPKKTNMDLINEEDIARIETAINERPMKCLDWLSPNEAFRNASPFDFQL